MKCQALACDAIGMSDLERTDIVAFLAQRERAPPIRPAFHMKSRLYVGAKETMN